jgi:hypothetical protein
MSASFARYTLPAIVCLILAGCGSGGTTGGGGGGGTNPTAVTVNITGATPAAIATQIGSGAFTAATASSNTVTLSVPSGTKNFAIAWVCSQNQAESTQSDQYVIEATTSDGTSYQLGCPLAGSAGTTGTLTLSVDASAFSTTSEIPSYLLIEAQDGANIVNTEPNGLVASNLGFSAPSGSDRVDLMVYANNLENGFASQYIAAAKSFTGVTVPGTLNGGNTVVFTSADAAVQEPITYNNIPSGFSTANSFVLVTPAGEQYSYLANIDATTTYSALPASIAQSGDTYYLSASSSNAVSSGQSSTNEFVSEYKTFAGEGSVTVTFPAPWSYSGPTPAALPTFVINYSGFAGQPNVADAGSVQWTLPSNANSSYNYHVTATSNYMNGSTSFQFPDLSSMAGFIPDPVSGATLNWTAAVVQSSLGPYQPESNSETGFSVADDGTYTVP